MGSGVSLIISYEAEGSIFKVGKGREKRKGHKEALPLLGSKMKNC